jgi:hypothetical protein
MFIALSCSSFHSPEKRFTGFGFDVTSVQEKRKKCTRRKMGLARAKHSRVFGGGRVSMIQDRISIRSLKELVLKRLPKESILRESILAESDELDPNEYIAKVPLWLVMIRSEPSR